MLKRLNVRRQLYGLCAIFIFPIVILAGITALDARAKIRFSAAEQHGVAYLQNLNPVLATIAQGKAVSSVGDLTQISTLYDTQMSSWEQSTQFQIAVASHKTRLETLRAGLFLVKAIGDGSNLILDPDLDSFYVMDLVIVRLPELLQLFTRLDEALASGQDLSSTSTRNELGLIQGQLAAVRNGVEQSMFTAVRNNGDGAVAQSMLKPYGKLIAQIDARVEGLKALLAAPVGEAEFNRLVGEFKSKHRAFVAQLHNASIGYLNILDTLLADRISAISLGLTLSLLLAAAVAALAVCIALVISRRIANNVTSISERIHKMTEGDFASPIPLQDHNDELGEIARSLTQFRAHAEENASLAHALEEERQASRDQLESLAYYDDLTGLPNRKFLNNRVEAHVKQGSTDLSSALIYLDLDGFKEVNDTMTHLAGDELLQEVARRLKGFVGVNDVVARLGGDEFAIFMTEAQDRNLLEGWCQSILQSLAEPYRVFNSMQYLSASAGVAVLPLSNERDSVEIVRRADVAMYRAKELGKNRSIFFDASFDAEALYRRTVESALREALPRGEIQLHFQPQFDAKSGCLVGVEGLARWTSQRHGEIVPSVFIPIAESSGLIYDLGMQMLRQAIVASARWPQLRVSVNLSVAQLRDQRFLDDVASLLHELNGHRGQIELEITESVVMEDDALLTEKLAALRDLGFELALDDFGTGYSSLGYLTRYNFDRLKIDRGFIRDAVGSPRGAALLEAIARMGRALGMDVCAEGVETFEDVTSTTEAGCTLLQGFYFSPAVSTLDIDRMIAGGIETMPRAPEVDSTIIDRVLESQQRMAG